MQPHFFIFEVMLYYNKENQRIKFIQIRVVNNMAKIKSVFVCEECGYESPKWMGKCPDCGNWNTFTEEQVVQQNKAVKEAIKVRELARKPIKKLSEVTSSKVIEL